MGSWAGVSDLEGLDLNAEEVCALGGLLVEPIEGLAVLLAKLGRNPNDRRGSGPSRIGEDLAEMAVVGVGQLVLDDQDRVVGGIAANQIE